MLATLSTGCARCARSTRGNSPPPLRGGIHVGDAFHGLRSLRSLHPWQPTSAPPGGNPCWRRFPRVALAALASPVATILRPSGAADPCASAVQTRPFVTGKRPSSPRRGAGLLPRVERTRRVSATRGSGRRRIIGRPGGAEETRGGQGAAEAPGAPGVSSAPPGRFSFGRRFPRVALAALASPV